MRTPASRKSSSPLLRHDDQPVPPGNAAAPVAAKPRPTPPDVGAVLSAATANPLGPGLHVGRGLARQCGDDDLASRGGIAGDAAGTAVVRAGALCFLAHHESGILPPGSSV